MYVKQAQAPHISDITKKLGDIFKDPALQKVLQRGAAGALVGGGAANVMGRMARGKKEEGEERSSLMSPTLMGAILGGGGAMAYEPGMKLLKGLVKFPGEQQQPPRSIGERRLIAAGDKAIATASGPYAAGGGTLAALGLHRVATKNPKSIFNPLRKLDARKPLATLQKKLELFKKKPVPPFGPLVTGAVRNPNAGRRLKNVGNILEHGGRKTVRAGKWGGRLAKRVGRRGAPAAVAVVLTALLAKRLGPMAADALVGRR